MYLRLLIFLPAILIPAWASSSLVFPIMYSADKVKVHISRVTIYSLDVLLSRFVGPCPVLTVASGPAYKYSQEADRVAWYSHIFKNFPQFVVIHTVKGFSVVNEEEVNVFLEFSSFFSMIQLILAI